MTVLGGHADTGTDPCHPAPPLGIRGNGGPSARDPSRRTCLTGLMDANGWDERYAASDLVWSAEPNRFVAEELADLPPGRALDLAAGEGRNAIWLVPTASRRRAPPPDPPRCRPGQAAGPCPARPARSPAAVTVPPPRRAQPDRVAAFARGQVQRPAGRQVGQLLGYEPVRLRRPDQVARGVPLVPAVRVHETSQASSPARVGHGPMGRRCRGCRAAAPGGKDLCLYRRAPPKRSSTRSSRGLGGRPALR